MTNIVRIGHRRLWLDNKRFSIIRNFKIRIFVQAWRNETILKIIEKHLWFLGGECEGLITGQLNAVCYVKLICSNLQVLTKRRMKCLKECSQWRFKVLQLNKLTIQIVSKKT